MIRKFGIACAVLVLAATTSYAEGIKDDFGNIEKQLKNRPRTKEAFTKWLKDIETKVDAVIEKYEGKAADGDNGFWLARTLHLKGQIDYKNSVVHTKKAISFLETSLKTNPDHAESKKLLSFLKDRYLPTLEKRAKAEKKRQSMVGKAAPALPIDETLDGKKVTLEGLKGKVVIVDFWATWCGPCRKVIPHLVELKKQFGDKGLEILGVTRFYGSGFIPGKGRQGSRQKPLDHDAEVKVNKECGEKLGINYPIVFSKKAGGNYMVSGIPQIILIDKEGIVRHVQVGAGDHSKLDKLVKKYLGLSDAKKEPAEKPAEEGKTEEKKKF